MFKTRITYVLLWFFLFIESTTYAQQPVQLTLNEANGLPDNEVYNIVEDHKGFIWLACNTGLIRYDGSTFKHYSHAVQRGLSVFEPFVDSQNRVWCINLAGQLFYVGKNDELVLFKDLSKDLNGSLPTFIVTDSHVIVSMYLKQLVIDLNSKEQQIYLTDNDDRNYHNLEIINNSVLTCHNDSLFKFFQSDKIFLEKIPFESFKNNDRPDVGDIIALSENDYLLIQKKGNKLNVKRVKDGKWSQLTPPKELASVDKLVKPSLSNGYLWYATTNGVYQLEIDGSNLIIKNHFLKDYYTTKVVLDRDNNYWISTLKNGIFILPNIYIKTYSTDNRYLRALEKIDHLSYSIGYENGEVDYINKGIKESLNVPKGAAVTAMHYDQYRNGLFIFQKYKTYYHDFNTSTTEEITNFPNVKAFQLINMSNYVIGSSGNGSIGKIADDFKQTTIKYKKTTRVLSCYHDKTNETSYFGFIDGLKTKKPGDSLYEIKSQKGKPILANDFAKGTDGVVWISTTNQGVYALKSNKILEHLDDTILSSNNINTIALDAPYLWISTQEAIHKYNITTKKLQTLTRKDGLPFTTVRDLVVLKDRVMVGGTNGLFSLDKNKCFKKVTLTDFYFSKLLIDNKPVALTDKIKIKRDQSSIALYFNVNGLRGLSNGNFSYRIDTTDSWTPLAQGSNLIQFASLDSGDYNIQLKAAESDKIRTLYINVYEPFYNSWWFWLLGSAVVMGLIIFYYGRELRFRESEKNKQLKQLALDNELISLRLENLRSQMNPHFIFNALNSIQEYIVSNERNLASSYLVKFSRLIRMYLEQSRENEISLKEEVSAMQLYLQLEKVRFEDKLHYDLYIDRALDEEAVKVPPLFIQPYVENSLKHGLLHKKNNRELQIKFEKGSAHHSLIVTIIDNGIGREQAQLLKSQRKDYYKSFATYANNERVQLLNSKREYKITVHIDDLITNNVATGTQVRISIPQKL